MAGNIVLFGGTLNGPVPEGTWIWDGTTWTQLFPSPSPPPVTEAMMADDPAAGDLVLFGGNNQGHGLVRETWTWNGTAWTRLSPPKQPPALEDAAMAYDSGTGQLVLFGGDGKTSCLHGMWQWTGTTWEQLSPAVRPPACAGASMAYDPATGQLILFGGAINSGRKVFGDTWTWNGSTWSQVSP